jgi:CHAD domain-containing protein
MIMVSDIIKLKDIKPALYSYVREAGILLDPDVVPDDKKVHDLRVLMKKSRAVMKLIGSQAEREFHDREYATFRESGRIARSWRETAVHRKTLKDLKKKYPGVFSRIADNEKILSLIKKPEGEIHPSPSMKEDMEKITDLLKKSAYRIRFMKMNAFDPLQLLNQLESTYLQVRDCYFKSRHYPVVANLHEFRKKSKDFLYQLCFFRLYKPDAVRSLERRLDSLADNLGKYNDLAVMIKTIDYKYGRPGNDTSLDEFAVIIKQEQDKYLARVWPSAYRIFCRGKGHISLFEG